MNAHDDLQKVLNDAMPGDDVVLEAGATFTGNFILPVKTGTDKKGNAWIVIRGTKVNMLPPSGTRVGPSDAANMPKLVTPNEDPALATDIAAHYYRIVGLEITVAPKAPLNYHLVTVGDANTVDQLPTDITFDRVYVHGAVLCHCKRGLEFNSRRTAIVDSYVSDFHGITQDTQALCGWDGPGPFKIVNNYLEGAAENIIFGGAVPQIAGVIPSDIEFRRNYLAKPVRWRTSIIPAPQGVTASGGTGGTLSAGSPYYYDVVAVGPVGQEPSALSTPSTELTVTLPAAQSSVLLSWPPVSYGDATDTRLATEYRVYRTAAPPSAATRTWTSYSVPASGSPSFLDTGAAGGADAPRSLGTVWTVKNLFELKNAQRVLVDSNVFEYSWLQAQSGYALFLTPRVENGAATWAVTSDLTFTNNLIRHSGNGVDIAGIDSYCQSLNLTCQQSARVLFRNNILNDISRINWAGNGWCFVLGSSQSVTIDHNTCINDGSSSVRVYGTNASLTITNTIMGSDLGGDATIPGQPSLDLFAAGAVVRNNVFAGSSNGRYYPAGNWFPASFTAVGFVDQGAGNLALLPTSPYARAATDGTDVGVDYAALKTAIAGTAPTTLP